VRKLSTVDLRCPAGSLYGRVTDGEGTVEVKCKRRWCGYRPGVVVLHTIDLKTGNMVSTKKFAEPRNKRGRGLQNAHDNASPAVRAS
jgi:hypothetical protein